MERKVRYWRGLMEYKHRCLVCKLKGFFTENEAPAFRCPGRFLNRTCIVNYDFLSERCILTYVGTYTIGIAQI